jgi:hypothetical protein
VRLASLHQSIVASNASLLEKIHEMFAATHGIPDNTPSVPVSVHTRPQSQPIPDFDDDQSLASTIASQARHQLPHRQSSSASVAASVVASVAASDAAYILHTNSTTRHKDKQLSISKYNHSFDAPGKTRNFLDEVTHALMACPFYTPLLLPDCSINYNAPSCSVNRTLFHFLLERMDQKSQTIFRSFDEKTGTKVLKKIHKKISTVASRQVQVDQAIHQITTCKWDPAILTLTQFTAFVCDLKSILSTKPIKPTPEEYRRWWIKLLPSQFKDVQFQLTMDDLPLHWRDVDEIIDLAEATQIEIDTRLLKLSSPNKPKDKKPLDRTKPLLAPTTDDTTPRVPRADDSRRMAMPAPHTTSGAFGYHIRIESQRGTTRAALKSKYAGPPSDGCWLCRFKLTDPTFHNDTECKILNNLYPYVKPTVVSLMPTHQQAMKMTTPSIPSTAPNISMPPSQPKPRMMCYDTGTFPTSLCDDRDLFTSFTSFTSPKSVSLGDDATQIPALGQGIIDYIIDGKFRIQEEAILTSCTPIALKSAASHIKYDQCSVTASANSMTINYPTFSHTIPASDRFEFAITPGKYSSLPLLWSPTTATLCRPPSVPVSVVAPTPTNPPITMPKNNTRKQKIANKRMSVHLPPLQTIMEETLDDEELITTRHDRLPTSSTKPPHYPLLVHHDVPAPQATATIPIALPAPKIPSITIPEKTITIPEAPKTSPNFPVFLPVLPSVTNVSPDPVKLAPTPPVVPPVTDDPPDPTNLTPNPQAPTPAPDVHFLGINLNCPQLTSIYPPSPITHGAPSPLPSHLPPVVPTPTSVIPEHDILAYLDSIDVDDSFFDSVPSPLDDVFNLPNIPPSDRVSSTEPKTKLITTEYLQKCTGFRNIDRIIKNISSLAKDTILIRDTGNDPILSRGETATLPKRKSNSSSVPRPNEVGDVFHYDIGHGNGTAIGNIKYVLFLVDRKTRIKYVFGLKDLEHATILHQMKKFIQTIGKYPREMIADRDFRLIGQAIDSFFEPHSQVSGAPSGRQSQNGLCECNWRYICNIARNYMAEKLLPSEFWFFAISYAVQLSNYLPVKTDAGSLTTPFFEAYGHKPDYRKLLPLFSIAYVKLYDSAKGNTLDSQTVKAILVGNDPKSDGRLFYNPITKGLMGSSDYRLDISIPSGPPFNLIYNGGFDFNLFDNSAEAIPPAFDLGQTAFIQPSHDLHPSESAKILTIPMSLTAPYAVQLNSGDIIDIMECDLQKHDPNDITDDANPILTRPWLRHEARITLIIPGVMLKPKQGFLIKSEDNSWSFFPGRTLCTKSSRNNYKKNIPLPDFEATAESFLASKNMVQGWQVFKTFNENRSNAASKQFLARRATYFNSSDPATLSNSNTQSAIDASSKVEIIASARRVSAAGLDSLIEPKLHQHKSLSENDKIIWDKSYLEEYLGLHETTNTWEYITDEQYQLLRPIIGNALPSMAISKIKPDEKGNPDRAKYRIVVLGNLDPTNWSNSDCFAPVMSPLELRILIATATQMRLIAKTGDVSQAFCQSVLPDDEQYIIRPPHGCPITPSNTYLLLKKTLYGLRRSPRHWYNTCKAALESIGLSACPNAPCIFSGIIVEGEPPLTLGLFVDDFLYFSQSSKVEKAFEEKFGAIFDTDFQGEINHFLGINFNCYRDDENHVTVHMSQENDALELIIKAHLDHPSTASKDTPYRSGHPVDSVPDVDMPINERAILNKILQEYVGSLNWLSCQTRPDLATITNIISQFNNKCSPGHIDAAKYAIRYLKGTANLGIQFSSRSNAEIESFVQFPLDPTKIVPLTDANWGSQDQSVPHPDDPPILLDLFKTRSIAGFVIWLGGPLTWCSKRQTYTARSSCEAEIGSVDECTKTLQQIANILKDLGLFHLFTNGPIVIHNDNAACVQWSHNMTTKGIRYIQIRENAVREQVQKEFIEVQHIAGRLNNSDIFTKEDKDVPHFQKCRNTLVVPPPVI